MADGGVLNVEEENKPITVACPAVGQSADELSASVSSSRGLVAEEETDTVESGENCTIRPYRPGVAPIKPR